MNTVILIGNLTKDPDTTSTQAGVARTRFALAVSRRYKNEAGTYDADFISCVAWRQTAEYIAKFGAKGRKLAVNGELQSRRFEQDGQTRTVFDVIVNSAEFLDKRDQQETSAPAQAQTFVEVTDDDLPF